MKVPRGERAVLAGILLLALLLRTTGLPAGLPDLNRYFFDTDEVGLMDVAMSMGGGDLNPRYYLHPSLLPYLLLGAYGGFFVVGRAAGLFASPSDFAAFYWANKAPFHLVGRLLVVIFGVASVYLAYRIGRRAYGRGAGLGAGLLLAVAPLHVAYSQIIKTDVPSLFFGLLAVMAALRLSEVPLPRTALWAGVSAGLAAATRYPSGLFLLAPVVALMLHARHRNNARRAVVRCGGLVALGAVGGFLVGMPYALLDLPAFRDGLAAVRQLMTSPRFLIYYPQGQPPNWWAEHAAELASPWGVTSVVFVLGLVGVLWALWRRQPPDVVLLTCGVGFYAFYSLPMWRFSPIRFLLPVVPILLVLGARALSEAALRLRLGRGAVALATVLLAVLPAWSSTEQVWCGVRTWSTREAREWVEANLSPGTRILMSVTHVPQLSFTLGSLERWEIARRPSTGIVGFSRSRREQFVAGREKTRLLALRRDALTVPPQYDLYILPEETAAPEWDYYRLGLAETVRRYGIQYVITSTWYAGRFTSDVFDPTLIPEYSDADRRRFFRELERTGTLVREFVPACGGARRSRRDDDNTTIGIRIYRIGA